MRRRVVVAEILKAEQLRELTGFSRDADVRRCLESQGIVVFDSKAGPWTTQHLIELAAKVKLGLAANENKQPLL